MTIEEFTKEYGPVEEFYPKHPGDTVLWIKTVNHICGMHSFTFDKKIIYNLFLDFPDNLTDDQIRLFCKDNPFWVHDFDGFRDRLISRGFDPERL